MKKYLPALAVALVIAVLVYWRFYEPKTFIPNRLAYDYSQQFKIGYQIEPGWVLRSVGRRVDRPTRIVHVVEVRPELAGELLSASKTDRIHRVGEVACPPAEHQIWKSLTSRQDVEIDLKGENGIFAVVSCRQALF